MENKLKVELLADEGVIKETLSRIGIVNKQKKLLFPSCYLMKEQDGYFIYHFKEIFSMKKNGYNNVSEEDMNRKNAIVFCLYQWGLIDVDIDLIEPHDMFVFVLPHDQKKEYTINHKINVFNLDDTEGQR